METNDIECPNCGASVYYELTRCPKCGWNLYDADANEAFDPPASNAGGNPAWVGSARAILLGSLAAAALAFVAQNFIGRIYSPQTLTPLAQVILFLSGPFGALGGGYLAGALAKRQPAAHGLAVGVLTIGAALVLETHWRDVDTSFMMQPVTCLDWIMMIVAGMGGALLYMRLNEQASLPAWITVPEQDLYRDLLAKAHHDPQTAERLIALERQKTPQASRRTLIQNAIERWLHDNR